MTRTAADTPRHRIPAFGAWIAVTVIGLAALTVAFALLATREPDTVFRDVPSRDTAPPTEAMLAEVARLEAETGRVSADMMETLRFVAAYVCPPGTASGDIQRIEDLKARAREMLASHGSGAGLSPEPAAARIPKALPPSDQIAGSADKRLSPAELSGKLEQAVVFILSVRDRQIVATGTGFFIEPGVVATNRHVVELGEADRLILTSEALGDVVRARVVAVSPSSTTGNADFALLRTDGDVAPGVLPFAVRHSKLMRVSAAGFPGLALGSDEGFLRLVSGDRTAAPDMHQNSGEVRSTQNLGDVQSIIHTADVLSGYSGGPLVDMCGRVVGMNTFIQVDRAQSSKLNSALAAETLLAFINQHEYSPDVRNSTCN